METIFETLFLREEARGRALEQLWSLQTADGERKGDGPGTTRISNPWEGPSSFYFGSAVAAIAIGTTPADYRSRPDILAERPLHNRIDLLWASSALPEVLPADQPSAYATAFTSYVLLKAGTPSGETHPASRAGLATVASGPSLGRMAGVIDEQEVSGRFDAGAFSAAVPAESESR